MNLRRSLLGVLPLIAISFAGLANAADLTASFDAKHKECLERIAIDSELAFEEAMIWQDDGGGRRAKHCVAMALFARGHEDEAANFWLVAKKPDKAYQSATDGLALKADHLDLRISRARAYAMSGFYEYAEIDLNGVLSYDPKHAGALRYRADARLQQGRLSEAKTDIENSLAYDPTVVETALLRGQINEAIRKAK